MNTNIVSNKNYNYIVKLWADRGESYLADKYFIKSDKEITDERLKKVCSKLYKEQNDATDRNIRDYEWEIIEIDETQYEVIDLRKESKWIEHS